MSDLDILDLGSSISGLVLNGFPSSTLKVTNECTHAGYRLATKFKADKQNRMRGVISPEYEIKDLDLVVSAKLDTRNTGRLALAFSNLGIKGSNLKVSVAQGVDEKKIETNLGGEWKYQTDIIGIQLGGKFNLEKVNPPSFEGRAVFQKPNNFFWTVAGSTEASQKIIAANLTYLTNRSEANFSVRHKKTNDDDEDKTTYTSSWSQKLSPTLNYGVVFKTSVGGKKQLSSTGIVVAEHQVDQNMTLRAKTTTKAAQCKVYPCLRIGFGLTQKLSPNCHATIGADFNARHLTRSGPEGAPHSLGFELKLS